MGSLTNFLANRKTPGLNLDQLDRFEGKFVPTGLALMVPIDQLGEDPDNPRKAFPLRCARASSADWYLLQRTR